MRARSIYLWAVLVTIVVGLGARKLLPGYVSKNPGDVLYATMMYWGVRYASPLGSRSGAALIALAICAGIELLKLWHAGWLDGFRSTTIGKLILGSVFTPLNFSCYAVGAVIGLAVDWCVLHSQTP